MFDMAPKRGGECAKEAYVRYLRPAAICRILLPGPEDLSPRLIMITAIITRQQQKDVHE